jgi:hypothetical protein
MTSIWDFFVPAIEALSWHAASTCISLTTTQEPRRVQELALQAELARAAVDRVARDR